MFLKKINVNFYRQKHFVSKLWTFTKFCVSMNATKEIEIEIESAKYHNKNSTLNILYMFNLNYL